MSLYIFWFLHQTTTLVYSSSNKVGCISFDSYIKPQHALAVLFGITGCISFDSYIKPQHSCNRQWRWQVVYLLIPTSNHNSLQGDKESARVVYLLIPTSNHNSLLAFLGSLGVVYLLIPTSNHNAPCLTKLAWKVVYLLIPTSNHNGCGGTTVALFVVYLLIPTSNHNFIVAILFIVELYIFWFLHQTTTSYPHEPPAASCISFDSYIKPQLIRLISEYNYVVYLLIPTSNHNFDEVNSLKPLVVYLLIPTSNHNDLWRYNFPLKLYIFWFLHQTTTDACALFDAVLLYIFWFLHQTTTAIAFASV